MGQSILSEKTMASQTNNNKEPLVDKVFPSVKADEDDEPEEEEEAEEEEEDEEDLIDPAVEIKEKCADDHCTKYKNRLDECNDRVTSKNNTTETCLEEILDFYHCVDHCAGAKIFDRNEETPGILQLSYSQNVISQNISVN